MQQHKQVPRMNSFIYFTSQIHRTLIKMLHESAPPPPPTPSPPSLNCSSSVLRSRRDHDRFWRDCFTHLPPPKINSVLGRAQMSSSLQQLSPFFHIKIYEHCSNHLLFSLIQKKIAIKQAAYYVISVLRFLSDQKQPKIIYVDFSTPLLFMQN